MNKSILEQYNDSKARVKYLKHSIDSLEKKMETMRKEKYMVSDVVSRGRKGSHSLGTVKITGFPMPEYDRLCNMLQKRMERMEAENQELIELTCKIEEYISGITEVEIRNILSLYYVDDLNWIQVSHRMNGLYQKKKAYTEGSCRLKHDRYLKKN